MQRTPETLAGRDVWRDDELPISTHEAIGFARAGELEISTLLDGPFGTWSDLDEDERRWIKCRRDGFHWWVRLPRKQPTVRRQRQRSPRPLTAKQTEVVQIVGECKGNIADAARRLDLNRKTVAEQYEAAIGKLGEAGNPIKLAMRRINHPSRLPFDRRGQSDVADTNQS